MSQDIAIHWFRQDLRLADNPALTAASRHQTVLPLYILDDDSAGDNKMGAASKVWLHHSLTSLSSSLDGQLSALVGNAEDIICDLVASLGISAVYWNRCYEPWRMARDARIKTRLKAMGVTVQSFNGSLLWEPWTIAQQDGSPYTVFTPFYRKGCLKAPPPRVPLPPPAIDAFAPKQGSAIENLDLLPTIPWHKPLEPLWQMSESGAQQRLEVFCQQGLSQYKVGRNQPAKPFVSRLSPYLRFGEISPQQVWHVIGQFPEDKNTAHFCSELGWREFAYSLLFHNHDLPTQNLQRKFDRYPWRDDPELLRPWQKGETGVPIVDAAMRELWQTGYMHNRTRMIAGSYLVKNLGIHWRHGERWFWDTLFDADLANNSASWQWVAGSGADAAPYFRIFNPVSQAQKFDPGGDYIRQFVPELRALSNDHIFCPWQAPIEALAAAGIVLGETYPRPAVDLKATRDEAVAAFDALAATV